MKRQSSALERQMRTLEEENQRLRESVASLRRDRTELYESFREGVRRCSNP